MRHAVLAVDPAVKVAEGAVSYRGVIVGRDRKGWIDAGRVFALSEKRFHSRASKREWMENNLTTYPPAIIARYNRLVRSYKVWEMGSIGGVSTL